jgi:hypothetical protein
VVAVDTVKRPRSVAVSGRSRWTNTLVLPGLLFVLALLAYLATSWIGSMNAAPVEGAGFSIVVTAFLGYSAIGALVAVRRPEHHIGWLLCVIGFSAQVQGLALAAAQYTPAPGGLILPGWIVDPWLMPPLRNLWVVTFSGLGLLLLIFPNTRLFSRPLVPGLALAAFAIVVGLVTSSSPTATTSTRFPLFDAFFSADVADRLYALGQTMSGLAIGALLIPGAISMVVRLRRARGVERQQMKWIAYAAVVLALVFVGGAIVFFSPLRALDPGARIPPAMFGGVPFALALIALPIGAAVAILRYRLYDIDVLINRTLVYGLLTAALAGTYFAGVVVLQAALRPITGGSEVAVALSTLSVVALFAPLRRRIQAAVDRRFYRSRYDAQRTLDAFGARLRNEVDLDSVRSDLLDVIADTVHPAHASVWLREASR